MSSSGGALSSCRRKTRATPLERKVVGYALLASIQHYILVDPEERIVLHYGRREVQLVPSEAPVEDVLHLHAVGFDVPVADFFGHKPAAA